MFEMERVPHSEKTSLKDWDFGFGSLSPIIAERVAEAIEDSWSDFPPYLSLDYVWAPDDDGIGGPAVTEPDSIRVSLSAFSENVDVGPAWQTTISVLVDRFVDSLTEGGEPDGAISLDARWQVKTLRDKLRQIADGLDHCLSRPSKSGT